MWSLSARSPGLPRASLPGQGAASCLQHRDVGHRHLPATFSAERLPDTHSLGGWSEQSCRDPLKPAQGHLHSSPPQALPR